MVKQCVRCQETKSVDAFNRDSSRRDGLNPYCRPCASELKALRYRTNPERERARVKRYTDVPEHAVQARARARAWYESNKERAAQWVKRWRAQHPEAARAISERRRARLANGTGVTVREWLDILAGCNHECAACGARDNLTMDHILPLARGGEHSPANIQPLCSRCNARKGTKHIDYRGGVAA